MHSHDQTITCPNHTYPNNNLTKQLTDPMQNNTTRNNSIDNVRLLAIFAVVVIHSFPFFYVPHAGALAANIVANQLARFAVPCFFILSGYLFTLRVHTLGVVAPLRKSTTRIAMIYAFWCLFYILPYNVALITDADPLGNIHAAQMNLTKWTENPEVFFLRGSKEHLWFLPALLCAMLVCAPFIAYRQHVAMLIVGTVLFAIGLLAGPYNHTLIDITLPINVRNGPIFSSIFFAIGATLSNVKDTRRLARFGVILCVGGVVGQMAEIWGLARQGPLPNARVYPDYVFSTLALGTGPALLAISGAAAPKNKAWLWGAGRYTLGIYVLHRAVMDLFANVNIQRCFDLSWSLASPLIYFSLTILLVAFLSRFRFLRPLIT